MDGDLAVKIAQIEGKILAHETDLKSIKDDVKAIADDVKTLLEYLNKSKGIWVALAVVGAVMGSIVTFFSHAIYNTFTK